MLRLTHKRRENLVKLCVSAFTVDLASFVVPSVLPVPGWHVMLSSIGILIAILLVSFVYLLES